MAQRSRRFMIIWGILVLAGTLVTIPLMERLEHPELTRPILTAIVALAIVVTIYPELYQRLWFWVTMMVFTALHLPLILFIHWDAGWVPSPFILVFCLADVAIMIWVISMIQKLTGVAETLPK